MEWTTIDYGGTTIRATDFLDGVLVDIFTTTGTIFCPGYYVQEQRGDMDGPALRARKQKVKEFAIRVVEVADE
jgi:hypothetical protein